MTTPEINKAIKQINRQLSKIGTYHESIPLSDILAIISENGGNSGEDCPIFLCGENSRCSIEIFFQDSKKSHFLYLAWYRMVSGRYEITVYLS